MGMPIPARSLLYALHIGQSRISNQKRKLSKLIYHLFNLTYQSNLYLTCFVVAVVIFLSHNSFYDTIIPLIVPSY